MRMVGTYILAQARASKDIEEVCEVSPTEAEVVGRALRAHAATLEAGGERDDVERLADKWEALVEMADGEREKVREAAERRRRSSHGN